MASASIHPTDGGPRPAREHATLADDAALAARDPGVTRGVRYDAHHWYRVFLRRALDLGNDMNRPGVAWAMAAMTLGFSAEARGDDKVAIYFYGVPPTPAQIEALASGHLWARRSIEPTGHASSDLPALPSLWVARSSRAGALSI